MKDFKERGRIGQTYQKKVWLLDKLPPLLLDQQSSKGLTYMEGSRNLLSNNTSNP